MIEFDCTDKDFQEFAMKLFVLFKKASKPEEDVKKPFMDINAASEYTGISKNTLYGYHAENRIPYHKPGKKVFYKIEDLNSFILDEKSRFSSANEFANRRIKKKLLN
jgi:excisionase family DNA binding protein